MTRDLPTIETLRKLLRYEPDTGKLYWRERNPDMFNSTAKRTAIHACNNWNSKFSGKRAFVTVHNRGYNHGAIVGDMYLAHRVVWTMAYGEWPECEIDHINHNRTDNRLANLRSVTTQGNQRNASISKNNTSGVLGVSFDKSRSKWMASIMVDGKHIYLGRFSCIASAISARESANKKYGFHRNHGGSL